MKRFFTVLTLLPTAAFAHAGDHGHGGFWTNLRHLITEPDHVAMLIGAALLVAVVIYMRKGRSE